MSIVKMEECHFSQCVDILFASELGRNYYPRRELLEDELRKGSTTDELYVKATGGVTSDVEVLGVIWYQMEGMFHSFPYLHMIAVREDMRGAGLGTELMDFFEQDVLARGRNHIRTKAFLTVGSFNGTAEAFYQKRGYVGLTTIDGLFRRGISEKLMMKKVIPVG